MEKDILHTLRYFAHFSYAVSFDQLHLFHSKKITKKTLDLSLKSLKKSKKIVEKNALYTLGEYSIYIWKREKREAISLVKIKRIQKLIHIFQNLPQIKFVGLSGSVGMSNAEEDDDIDLFIITTSGRLWTARLASLFLASVLGIRRTRTATEVGDKACLNLFFSEEDLSLPKLKHTEYGAHEVLQVKPLINKNHTYERFLNENKWVLKLFPNAAILYSRIQLRPIQQHKTTLGNLVEIVAKKLQLSLINRHKTSEIITSTQLWFFPKDYERKLKKRLNRSSM